MAAKTNVPAEQGTNDVDHPVIREDPVKIAAKAWRTLKHRKRKDLDYWYQVGEGLLHIWNRLEADKNGKAPSRKEFGQYLEAAGLGDIRQQARSASIKLVQFWDELPLDQITANNPEVVMKEWRQIENQRQQAADGEPNEPDPTPPGSTVEDADYADAEPGDGGPAPVDAEQDNSLQGWSDTINDGPAQTSGSDPWWMKQANQIGDLPDLVTGIDPHGLASACKDVAPIEEKLTKDRRQRIRNRAEQILAFLDAFEEDKE